MKKGFIDLLPFCRDHDVSWGAITNGSAYLSDKIVNETVAARPFNINISMNSKRPEIHNRSRGIEGSLDLIVKGIRKVAKARAAAGQNFQS